MAAHAVPAGPHWVYRLHDATGRVLYVGCTSKLRQRLAHHKSNQTWRNEISHVDATWYSCRADALSAESSEIWTRRPLHNGHPRVRPLSTNAELVGARLRQARGERSGAVIGEALGVTAQTVYRWEAGIITVPPDRYAKLADVLGAPWFELFAPAEVA